MATDYRTLAALAKLGNQITEMRRALYDTSVDDPVRLVITHMPVIEQGATNMQIHDNEQFDITVDAEDAKGFAVADGALTVTSSDNSVVSVVAGSDGKTFTLVAGSPGSAVVTVTDGILSATEAVDVIAGDVAKIAIAEGTATTQPTPSASPAPAVPPADVPVAPTDPAAPVA